jgi:hypothetical protein
LAGFAYRLGKSGDIVGRLSESTNRSLVEANAVCET